MSTERDGLVHVVTNAAVCPGVRGVARLTPWPAPSTKGEDA